MLNRSTDIGFSRGLHTDSLGVEGALLEAQDVVILRDGELRKRGGKPNISTVTGGASAYSFGYGICSAFGVGVLASFSDGTNYRFNGRKQGASSFTSFGTSRLNSAGATPSGFGYGPPSFMFSHQGEIIAGSTAYAPVRWCGSAKSRYATGTVSTTSGSTTITGSGTTWSGNVEAGMFLHINSGTLLQRTFKIVSVASNTSLTVDQAPDATVAGVGYSALPLGAVTSSSSMWGGGSYWPQADAMCSHQGRIFAGSVQDSASANQDERVRWSATPSETSGKFIGCDYWHANGYTDIGVGVGGSIVALISYGGELLVFKEGAVFVLRGVVSTDGSDLGARVEIVSQNHGLGNWKSVAASPIGVVFVDGTGAHVYQGGSIRPLTRGRIQRWWDANMSSYPAVSVVGSRIIFCLPTQSGGLSTAAVYDYEADVWTTQVLSSVYGGIVQSYTSTSPIALEYEMGLRVEGDAVDDWAGDFSTSQSVDAGGTVTPDLQVVTHPIALSDPVGNARPVRVDVNGYASGAALDVSIIPGRQGGTEFAVGTLPTGSTDKSHRLRVPPGASLNAYYQVKLATSATMSDARIYGVSILSAPSGRVDV